MATWFTVKQVAEYLQLSVATIYSMTRDGRLPASRVGGQWRFSESEIDNWLKAQNSNRRNFERSLKR